MCWCGPGVGATLTLRLGNKVPLAALGISKQPLEVSGTVRAISDGEYTVTGPIYTGQRCAMGRRRCIWTSAVPSSW